MAEPCPLIEIAGAPHDRGLSYGRQAAVRIRRGIEHYGAQLKRLDLDKAAIDGLAQEFLPVIEGFDADYVVEMRGIAEGAEVSFGGVLMLNARTEVLKLATRADLRSRLAMAREAPDGCTGVVALPSATADGRVIHAQNWDWKAECADTAVVLRVRREDGPDILTFTEAGGLARSGLNAAGIGLTANYLESDRDYRDIGLPLALIRRKVLEQESLAAAMRAVYVTGKSASNNMIVSHAGGIAIDFECAPDETFQVLPDGDGLIVHANHWQSPVALSKLRDMGIQNMPDSLYRDLRVRGLLALRAGHLSIDDVKAALFDDFQTPFSVCRPPRPNSANNLTATVAMVVMQPDEGVMDVAVLPALDRRFTRYTLEPASLRQAAE